ncbi:MAG: endolytic transglycosylase MltG [Polyangiaceae bacterium]
MDARRRRCGARERGGALLRRLSRATRARSGPRGRARLRRRRVGGCGRRSPLQRRDHPEPTALLALRARARARRHRVSWRPPLGRRPHAARAPGAARQARRYARQVAVPEGFTHVDIAKRLHSSRVCSRKAFVDAVHDKAVLESLRIDGPSAEGYLFPATYDFPQDSLASDVVRRMKLEFDKRYAAIEEKHGAGVNDLQSSLNWGRKDIVTLASMVEKEAAVDDERPLIAGVFLNRLRDPKFTPKLLQSDPTAAYGCIVDPTIPSCRTFTGKITHALLNDPANVYSTYTNTPAFRRAPSPTRARVPSRP